jgi:PAS domain-containing protein
MLAAINRYLGVRVAVLVGGAMSLLLAGTLFVCATALDYSFGVLQDRITIKSLVETGRAIDQAARTKLRLVHDSAAWDDTFEFLAGSNPEFPRTNYGPEVDTSGEDAIFFYDLQKRLVAAVQPQESANTWSPPPGVDPRSLLKEESSVGLLAAGGRVWMLAASPVSRTDGSGPSNGWLVYGTAYTQKRLKESFATDGKPVGFATKRDVPTDAWIMFPTREFGKLTGYYATVRKAPRPYPPGSLQLPAIGGGQLYMIVSLQIPVYHRMLQTRVWMIAISIFCGVVFVGLSVLSLQIHVIRPISALEGQMTRIAEDEETDSELAVTQRDEIGRLATAANRLLARARTRQQEAEDQHRLVETILDSATEGLIAYVAMRDAAGEITDFQVAECNRAAERICHARPGEFIGRRARELFPTIEEAGIFEIFTRVLASGRSEAFERAFFGERIKGWLRVSIVPWGDGVVVSFEDITQRKQHERELAETYAEIDRFNEAMIGREERVIEMKREVNALRGRLGLEPAYKEVSVDGKD